MPGQEISSPMGRAGKMRQFFLKVHLQAGGAGCVCSVCPRSLPSGWIFAPAQQAKGHSQLSQIHPHRDIPETPAPGDSNNSQPGKVVVGAPGEGPGPARSWSISRGAGPARSCLLAPGGSGCPRGRQRLRTRPVESRLRWWPRRLWLALAVLRGDHFRRW